MGKAVARKKKTIAAETLKDPVLKVCGLCMAVLLWQHVECLLLLLKGYVVDLIGKEVAKELKNMVSTKVESVLQSQDVAQLKLFSWDILLNELSEAATTFKRILTCATKTRVTRSNTNAVIGICSAILLNHRNQNMNLVQKIVALILHDGHASKQVQ